jgi:RHH-type transcriptional regulator, rel operon repressor / antitoxin RelB
MARNLCWPFDFRSPLKDVLRSLPGALGAPRVFYAREAILQHLEDLEDIYLADRALERIRSGKSKTVPLDEVMKRYGMDD